MTQPASLEGRVLFVTGATRGIGLSIATRAARDGAKIAVLGKTKDPHPKLPGTLDTACEQIERAGGRALGIQCDIRTEDEVDAAVARTVEAFGGIDILVNNASAIFLAGTEATSLKRYDLMNQVNGRGTYLCGQKCLPHLLESEHPRILTLSPPLDLDPGYFGPHVAYSIAKFSMSLCTLGWAREFRGKIAVNSLWPRTVIDTSAVRNLMGEDVIARSRSPEIVADAAHEILTRPLGFSGNFVIDEEILRDSGVTDFDRYATEPGRELLEDLFVPAKSGVS
jgi:citronellol/citronellal dehydrogenase